MTSDEFLFLAKAMRAAYSQQSFLPDEESIRVWYRMLKDLDGKLVATAVYRHISTAKFPPTIAEIREQCVSIAAPVGRDWSEGWSVVNRAISRWGMYRPQEALETIREQDPLAADIASQLGWESLCVSENPVADRASFRKAYEAAQFRGRELAKLPPSVRALTEPLSHNFLPGGTP